MTEDGPLSGAVVLEVGDGLPVAYAGRVLRSLGATVVKLESAARPDWLRAYGAGCGRHPFSCCWWHVNGAKHRAALAGDGAALVPALARLLAASEIALVGDGALSEQLEEALEAPDAAGASVVRIVPSVSLAREVVPAADESAGMPTGLRDAFGLEAPPEGLRLDIVEANAGAHAAATAALALARRIADPAPVRVDVGVYESAFSMIEIVAQTMLLSQRFDEGAPDMVGSPLAHPYYGNDGKALVINIYGRGVWERTCRAIGREDLIGDPRFEETFARYQFAQELRDLLDTFCGAYQRDEAVARLWAERIPSAPVLEPAELLRNEQVVARDVVQNCGIASPFVIDGARVGLEAAARAETEAVIRRLAGGWAAVNYVEQLDAVRIVVR